MQRIESYTFMGLALIFVGLISVFLLRDMMQRSRLAARITLATKPAQPSVAEIRPEGSPIIRLVSKLGMSVMRSGLLSGKTLAEMTATLEANRQQNPRQTSEEG